MHKKLINTLLDKKIRIKQLFKPHLSVLLTKPKTQFPLISPKTPAFSKIVHIKNTLPSVLYAFFENFEICL